MWGQAKGEKWLAISPKRPEIGHLDFQSFLHLTGRSTVQIRPSAPAFFNLLSFNQFTFPFSAPAENSGTVGNIRPATFANARCCRSGIACV